MTGFINYVDRKDKSHARFMEDFCPERDGTGACCSTSVEVQESDVLKGECDHIVLDQNEGIHTGDRLRGLVESNGKIRLFAAQNAVRWSSANREHVCNFIAGCADKVRFLIERDEDSDERHRVIHDSHILLSTQSYWSIDEMRAYI